MKQTFGKIIGKTLAPCVSPASYGPVRNALLQKRFVKSFCLLTEKPLLDLIYTV